MTTAWARALCRLLIALTLFSAAPAHAGLIGTADALQAGSHVDRARGDVARALADLGVDRSTALARVAAMSDDEARTLADQISAAPAGADAAGILLLVCVVALVWWAWKR